MTKVDNEQTLGLITWALETWSPPEQVQASSVPPDSTIPGPSFTGLPSCLMIQGPNMSLMSWSEHQEVRVSLGKGEAQFSRGRQNRECVLERRERDTAAHGCTGGLMK